jgi:hypothetical protein
MDDEGRREQLYKQWKALKQACAVRHAEEMKGRHGAAMMCICGNGCGGTAACSGLRAMYDLIRYLPTDGLPDQWRDEIRLWQSVIH